MKNEALKFLKKICKNRVKVTKKMVIFFLMTGGLLLSQVNFSESVDETKPATIKDLKNYDYPNSLHFVSVHYSKEDVKEYKDYYKYLDLLKKRLEYLKEIALEKVNGNNDKVKKLKEEEKKLKTSMEKLKGGNELISQKLSDKFEKNFKIPKNKDIKEINNEYAKRMNEINKLSSNFNNLGIDFAHSIAIGKGAEIKGENGIAIGVDTLSGKDSISLGKATNASGEGNIAIGRDATLFSKTFKGKIGQQIARILNDPNTIVKFENDGDVEYKKTIVIGDGTKSSGNSNIAIGDNAVAMKKRLTLISLQPGGTLSNKDGAEIDARNWNDIAKQFYNPGNEDKRSYKFEAKPVENAIALGKNASAFANNVIAIGKGAISGFESAVSIGENADTEGENSVAIGKNSKIFGESSVAIGEGSRTGKIKYVLKTIEGKDKVVENPEEFDTIEAAKQELEKKKDLSKIYRIEIGGKESENSVAIGKGSAVEYKGSVAIGADSLAVESNGKSAFTEVDHTSGETVSFGNSNKKRRLTNVADGKDSSDAVTVAQLQKAIADNKGGSGGSAVDSKLKLSDGKETKDLSLKDDTLEIANGTNTTVSLSKDDANKKATFKVNVKGNLTGITSIAKENGSKLTLNDDNITVNKKITGLEDGSISANSKDAINGGQLNKELDKKINKDDLDVTGDGKYITVTNEDNTKKKYKVAFNESELTNTITNNINNYKFSENKSIQDMLDKKANKDASNLDDKDVENWQNKLGNGSVAKDDTKLVKGGTVFTYVDNTINTIKQELSTKTTEDLAKKLNVDADNLSNTGKTNLTNSLGTGAITDNNTELVKGGVVKTYVDNKLKDKLSSDDVNVTGDEYITVTTNKNKYALSLNKEKLGANIDISNNNTITNINTELGKKANLDASNVTGDSLTKWQNVLGTGTIDNGNTGLVNGGVVKTYVDNQIKNNLGTINTSLSSKLSDINITGDKYIKATKVSNSKYTLTLNEDELNTHLNSYDFKNNTTIQNINNNINDINDKKANKDGSNIEDVTTWQNKLGTGTIDNGNTGLVNGGVVKTYVDSKIDTNTNTINAKLDKKLDKDGLEVKGDTKYITVTPSNDNNKKIYTVKFDDSKLTETIKGSDFSNNTSIKSMLDKKANLDATNLKEQDIKNWQDKLGTGKVEDGNSGLVTGQTVNAVIKPINEKVNTLETSLNDKLSDITINGDDYIKTEKASKGVYNLSLNKDSLETLINSKTFDLSKNDTITNINTELGKKANLDASNLKEQDIKDWQTKLGNGSVTDNNTGLVNGGTVKTYVDSKIENSTNTINTTLDTKLNKDDLEVTGDDKYIDVTNEDATKKKYKVAFKESALKQLVNDTDITNNTYLKTKLDTKADKDAGNLDEKDIENWQNKLGNGTVTDGDTKLVKGGTVFTYVNNTINTIKQEISTKATEDLAKKLDIDANNLNDTGVTNLTKALGKGEIKDNDNKLVTGGTVKAYITEEINDINTKVSGKLSSSDVDVKGDDYIKVNKGVDKPNHYSLVFNKEQLATDLDLSKNTKLNEQFGKYALLDGSNLENINLNVWQAKLGDGAIASGNTGLVKGGDVFTYVNNIKQELNNRATQDLSNKLDKGGTNLDKDSLDKLTNKLSEESNLTTPTNRLVTDTKVSEVLKGKLDIDADNLSDKGVTNLTTKLGTGVVKENNTGLITGGKVYEVKKELNNSISTNTQNITDLNNKYTTLNNQVTTNTNDISKLKTDVEDLKNTKQDITKINNKLGDIDKSITNINTTLDGKLDKTDLSIKGDNYIKVDKDDKFNYKLSLNKDTLAKDLDLTNNNSINNMFTTKLGDINTNIGDLTTKVETNTNNINSLTTKVDGNTNKISDLTTKVDTNTKDINTLKQDMTKKLNVDADNLTTKGETNLINKLSKDSNIAKPKDRLVTDKQVNKYLSRYNDALGVVDKKSTVALEKSELALGGVANAVAMANLVQVNSYSRHRHNLSAAYGYYGGSHALAVGFSGTNEERNFVYKLSGSVNNKGNLAFGVGAGVMLGDKDERLTTEYSTKLKTVEKDLVEANKKIKEYEERQKATDIKVKELERKLNQILNKH